ncbi:MAG: riboflavin kinase/FMN adenylyltransferase [Planctomycetota bacterium]|jgi:riboflavin kinase/FMN adenylyltransferase
MRITTDRQVLGPPPENGAVLSLGVFDGVHLGHQAILAANVEKARELGAEATVVTFSGHPKEILLGRAPRTLTTLDHRLNLFERAGIEHTIVLPFDEEMRNTPAAVFASDFLVSKLDTRHFMLGFDSKFGAGREGDAEFLRAAGYPTTVVPMVVVNKRGVSSTAIREAVELGDLESARAMLGRRASVLGAVVRGAQLGRQLGFRTANLDLHHELHPPVGVYACFANLIPEGDLMEDCGPWQAVTNIGFRPTVDGTPAALPIVEVHIFDFEGDIYGRRLELEFVDCLRGEKKFDGIEQLKIQIAEDAAAARALLKTQESVVSR